jgi:hypothetical protein
MNLDYLSHGAAVVMDKTPTYRLLGTSPGCVTSPGFVTNRSLGIVLANGKSVTILPKGESMPFKWKFIFATSQDNQNSATVQLCRDSIPDAKVTLVGLMPRSGGHAPLRSRFKLMIGPLRH